MYNRIDFGIVFRVFSCFQNVYYSSRVTDVQRTLLLFRKSFIDDVLTPT